MSIDDKINSMTEIFKEDNHDKLEDLLKEIERDSRWFSVDHFKQERSISYELTRNISIISIVFIGFTISSIGVGGLENVTNINKGFLIISWIFLLIGILFGFLFIFSSQVWLNKVGNYWSQLGDEVQELRRNKSAEKQIFSSVPPKFQYDYLFYLHSLFSLFGILFSILMGSGLILGW